MLYIVSPIDSWINVRLRVYFVKVSLFVLQCICLCKDMIYYNICCDYQTVFFRRLFLSLFFYLHLFSKQKTEEIVIRARTNLSFFFLPKFHLQNHVQFELNNLQNFNTTFIYPLSLFAVSNLSIYSIYSFDGQVRYKTKTKNKA